MEENIFGECLTLLRRLNDIMGGQVSFGDGANDKSFRKNRWELVSSADLQSWRSVAQRWGFDNTIDFSTDLATRLQPWCTGGHYLTERLPETELIDFDAELQQLDEQSEGDSDTENSMDELAQHALKPIQMIGSRDHLAVVQVISKENKMDFVIIDRDRDVIKGILRKRSSGKPYLCECYISPDLSHLLIKPNPFYIESHPDCFYDNSIKLIGVREDRCTINAHMFEGQATRYVLAFDPRYDWSRVAIGNRFSGINDVVSLCDLRTGQIYLESDSNLPQTTQNLVYSPDGRFLASLVRTPVNLTRTFDFSKVYIYDSDTLAVLNYIPCNNMTMLKTLTPGAIFPLFSNSGSHLVVGSGTKIQTDDNSRANYQQVTGVDVYRVPPPMCLQEMCRSVVRTVVNKNKVNELPLPQKVKQFLMFVPVYH